MLKTKQENKVFVKRDNHDVIRILLEWLTALPGYWKSI